MSGRDGVTLPNNVTLPCRISGSAAGCISPYLKGIRVKFMYEGHRVKVEITGTRKVPQYKTSVRSNSGSIQDTAVQFA